MKSLVQTITLFVALNLITAGFASAQPAPAPTTPEPAQVETVEAEVKEQAKAARRQLETAKSTGEKALSKLRDELSELRVLGTGFTRSDAGTVLVIPTSEMKAEDLVTIVEDMTVMTRIFDKQMGKEQSRHTGFSWYSGDFIGHSNRMAETMYLQGYGALFLKQVDFPLSPISEIRDEEKQPQKEDADPVWEQTRRDIFEPQEERKSRKQREEEKYDAEKVENLKTNTIKALKHAANIRNLKPAESVIITITGSDNSSNIKNIAFAMTTSDVIVKNKETTKIIAPSSPHDWEPSSPTILIIRAKKSDIDEFSNDELDFDQFRQRVQIFMQ